MVPRLYLARIDLQCTSSAVLGRPPFSQPCMPDAGVSDRISTHDAGLLDTLWALGKYEYSSSWGRLLKPKVNSHPRLNLCFGAWGSPGESDFIK